jgi:hypothetical protein
MLLFFVMDTYPQSFELFGSEYASGDEFVPAKRLAVHGVRMERLGAGEYH